jgi:methyl-accepting chemotaxis protein
MAQDELDRIADELNTLQGSMKDDLASVQRDADAIRAGQEPTEPAARRVSPALPPTSPS